MRTTVKIPQPVVYREETATKCDGCGTEVSDKVLLGWLRVYAMVEDKKGGVVAEAERDFCPECRPKIERALDQEQKAIKAEKLEVVAEVAGISLST